MGGTPKEMLARSPEFTYRRLLQAAKMAEKLGAQIMGLGAFTKVVGDAGITVARRASIPITTGNSYSASGALWAAADAMRRMGLVELKKGQKRVPAKTRLSLLARWIFRPAQAGAKVGGKPAAPTLAAMTVSTSGRAAMRSSAAGP